MKAKDYSERLSTLKATWPTIELLDPNSARINVTVTENGQFALSMYPNMVPIVLSPENSIRLAKWIIDNFS